MNFIGMDEVDLALTQNDIAYFAFRGHGFHAFEGNQISNVRAITRLYPETVQVVAQVDANVSTMADFLGKRISVGAAGSGNEANARQIFPFYGLTYDNTTPFIISYAESVNHFKDRQIDGFIFTTGAPNSGIMDIVTMHEVDFIPIDGPIRDSIIEEFPFFTREILRANTYSGQTEDVETIAVQAILVVRDDLPDDIVYAMTKALFENLEAVRAGHFRGNDLTPERALDGLTVPLHPGAERYFREIGVIN
jgi:TRAP transporter TAXI family solute receptor